jgi:hypothetical protein
MESIHKLFKAVEVIMNEKEPEPELLEEMEDIPKPKKRRKKKFNQIFDVKKK